VFSRARQLTSDPVSREKPKQVPNNTPTKTQTKKTKPERRPTARQSSQRKESKQPTRKETKSNRAGTHNPNVCRPPPARVSAHNKQLLSDEEPPPPNLSPPLPPSRRIAWSYPHRDRCSASESKTRLVPAIQHFFFFCSVPSFPLET